MNMERLWKGFGWGVLATVAMSALMILGMLTGVAPMPKPIPPAIVGKLTGGGLPQPAIMALGALLHLGYGGTYGRLMDRQMSPEHSAEAAPPARTVRDRV